MVWSGVGWAGEGGVGLVGVMSAKEQLQQVVDAMDEEQAAGVLRLISLNPEIEDLIADDLAGAAGGDKPVAVKEGKPDRAARKGAVAHRRIPLPALARELSRFKRKG